MKRYNYTRRVTKIIHDPSLFTEQKCKQLEPLIISYLLSSYRIFLYKNGTVDYYLTGSELNKMFKDCSYEFDIIEWGRVKEFKLPYYWEDKYKNYPDRYVLHFIVRFKDKYPMTKKDLLLRKHTCLDFYISLKKFAKSMG